MVVEPASESHPCGKNKDAANVHPANYDLFAGTLKGGAPGDGLFSCTEA